MDMANQQFRQEDLEPQANEKRINMIAILSDMIEDNQELQNQILHTIKRGIYVVILGIGQDFNSNLATRVTKYDGASFYTALSQADIVDLLVGHFDYNFFPCVFDVNLRVESDGLVVENVFGNDDQKIYLESSNDALKQVTHHKQEAPKLEDNPDQVINIDLNVKQSAKPEVNQVPEEQAAQEQVALTH